MQGTKLKSYRILAVDDNDLNLGLFKLFLTQLGHQVTACNNPIKAIEIAQQASFDLIFTDIQMPEMSGIEAAAEFRRLGFNGPILALTAHLSSTEEQRILASAVNGVLIKPVTKKDLTKTINQWMSPANTSKEVFEVRNNTAPYNPSKIFDSELALQRANGSKELALDMIPMLLESIDETMTTLTEATQSQLGSVLHKLAGGLRFSGAARLEAWVDEMQLELHKNPDLTSLTNNLNGEIAALKLWLQQHPEPF